MYEKSVKLKNVWKKCKTECNKCAFFYHTTSVYDFFLPEKRCEQSVHIFLLGKRVYMMHKFKKCVKKCETECNKSVFFPILKK